MDQTSCNCFFVSDLHGNRRSYRVLFDTIEKEIPRAVFLGGDLLPSALHQMAPADAIDEHFLSDFLARGFSTLSRRMGDRYPRVFMILGNDDGRFEEAAMLDLASQGIWEYVHNRCAEFDSFKVWGYSYIPPSPFQLKDWERYDVSRYVDPGSTHPHEGTLSIPRSRHDLYFRTIQEDLEELVRDRWSRRSIFLFHAPPYQTLLDRAALDGKMIDHVPLDVHIGSIAIRRFIEKFQPRITLHGHVHESSAITGSWKDQIGETRLFSAAYQGEELSLVQFDPLTPGQAVRRLL